MRRGGEVTAWHHTELILSAHLISDAIDTSPLSLYNTDYSDDDDVLTS